MHFAILFFVLTIASATLDSNSVRQNFNHDNSKTHNDVKQGDQSIGGVHIFEFHAPGGGMGIGIKLLIVAIIAVAVGYWCLKEKCKICSKRFTPIHRVAGDLENAIELQPCGRCRQPCNPEPPRRAGVFE